MADFDTRTVWPSDISSLRRFDPRRIMQLGRDPGLGVRLLHKQGITGKGISIGIIDQGLLVDHREYKDRLRMYEEIHCADNHSVMHGPAVVSVAAGKTVGVAPEADIYYVAETNCHMNLFGQIVFDYEPVAQALNRLLDVNAKLPKAKRMRVISLSLGWEGHFGGCSELAKAVGRAEQEGVFFVSCSLDQTYSWKPRFHGLDRDPLDDPNKPISYKPGLWWARRFYESGGLRTSEAPRTALRSHLAIPMGSRCTAAPTGTGDYVFYRTGGWSWCIPYIAGLYALACQVKPDVTPEEFWKAAIETGDFITVSDGKHTRRLGTIVNPPKLIERVRH